MLMLTGVDVIEHTIGFQRFVTVFRTGNVSRGVEVTAILFLDDDAHRLTFFVLEFIQEHHGCAFTFNSQTFLFQIGNNARQHIVIKAFTHHVIARQRNVHAVIDFLVLTHGDVDQLLPHLAAVLIAAL